MKYVVEHMLWSSLLQPVAKGFIIKVAFLIADFFFHVFYWLLHSSCFGLKWVIIRVYFKPNYVYPAVSTGRGYILSNMYMEPEKITARDTTWDKIQ